MANKLGSFGKTLGSKLKKNMGGLMPSKGSKPAGVGPASGLSSGTETLEKKKKNSLKSWKGGKEEAAGDGPASEKPTSESVGTGGSRYSQEVMQSLSSMRTAMQGEGKFIFVGTLKMGQRHQYQEEMIQRYLADAEERFLAEQKQKEAERKIMNGGVGSRARTHGAEGSKGGGLLARKASCMGRVLMRLSVKASGQSVVRWPREPLLPQRLSPSPTPGLAGTFTSPAHQPSGRSHCPSGCPQQIGPGTGKRHMWYHIQEPYGSHPHLVSTLLGTPGVGQGCERYGDGYSVQ